MTQLKESASSTEVQGPYAQFILFGDSITQDSCRQDLNGLNLMPALQHAYIRRLDVINRGFSGYTTDQAKKVLPQFMPDTNQANVEIMTIFFGANDSCLRTSPTGQHVPLAQYTQNLKDLVNEPTVLAHSPRIILITPPPISEYQLEDAARATGYKIEPTRSAEHTRHYAEACVQVGKDLDIPVVDIWSGLLHEAGWRPGDPLLGSKGVARSPSLEKFLSDGLHLSSPGYNVLFEKLMDALNTSDLSRPATRQLHFPLWDAQVWKTR